MDKKIVYIFGNPVEHSKSPDMHNAAYKALGLNFEYRKRLVQHEELKEAVNSLRASHIAGANITVPHKENVIPYLDELSYHAKKFGAVNTIINNNGKLKGYNTDGPGYIHSLKQENNFDLKNRSVAMFGAGGAAKAIAFSLEEAGISKLSIGEVELTKAQGLSVLLSNARAYQADSTEFLKKVAEAELVINTTPLGMHPNENKTPLKDLSVISPQQLYSDIVYVPQQTIFLKNALSKGAKVHYGSGMLLYQGVIAFEYFTGIKPDSNTIDIMKKTLLV